MMQDSRLTAFARKLRREMAPAERRMWEALRGRRFAGYRFRRQHVFEPYIMDYYCAACRLVVELDGESHLGNEQADRVRQQYLESAGFKVLRYWNTEVFDDFDSVLEAIYQECETRAKQRREALTPSLQRSGPTEPKTPHPQPLSPSTGRGE